MYVYIHIYIYIHIHIQNNISIDIDIDIITIIIVIIIIIIILILLLLIIIVIILAQAILATEPPNAAPKPADEMASVRMAADLVDPTKERFEKEDEKGIQSRRDSKRQTKWLPFGWRRP